MRKLSSLQVAELCQRYVAGESSPTLAKAFDISDVAVRGLLKRRGIVRRAQTACQRHYPVRLDAFSAIADEASAYWLGFLAADVAITDHAMELRLAPIDIGHLEKLRVWLQTTSPIRRVLRPNGHLSYYLRIHAQQILADLRMHGVTMRKSLTLEPPDIVEPALARCYIRGLFDGDGSMVSYRSGGYQKYLWAIETTPMMATWVAGIVADQLGISHSQNWQHRRPNSSVSIRYSGWPNVSRLLSWLYADASIYLDRKFNAAKNIAALGRLSIRPEVAVA